ncbi:MAG TPA: helix-turn-helix domain-containing protein [Gaiellaceae bacterium]
MSASSHDGVAVLRKSDLSKVPTPCRSDLDLIERVDQALDVLQGKWKVHLLFFMARGVRRHGRLLACLPGVSKKVMTDTLRALERDGLVARRIFAEVPVRVEYSLTPLGWSMTEPLIALSEWGDLHSREVTEAQAQYRNGSASLGSSRIAQRSAAA